MKSMESKGQVNDFRNHSTLGNISSSFANKYPPFGSSFTFGSVFLRLRKFAQKFHFGIDS